MKPKHHKLRIAMAGAILALSVNSGHAAVTFVGSLANDVGGQITSWSSSSVAKTFDIDGDNYYGSDGYTWMNTDDSSGAPKAVLHSIDQSTPSYTGGIAYTGAGTGVSGSFVNADNRLLPNGTGSANVGYAGANYNLVTGTTGGAVPLQQLFAYTMNRNMEIGETIRLGVILDSFNDRNIIGADSLRVVAGGSADATIGAWNRNGVMDMYFFDITGLTTGQQIQIWGAKAVNQSDFGYNAITIGGVTFDSIPEPSVAILGGLGLLALLRRRRS